MLITAYHASLCKIDKFKIPFNGLHFGGKDSAYQAVERKCIQNNCKTFYLHKVVLDVSRTEDVFDQGDGWREYLQQDTSKIFSYTNKYEPSTSKSYVTFNTDFIVDVVDTQLLSLEECLDYSI